MEDRIEAEANKLADEIEGATQALTLREVKDIEKVTEEGPGAGTLPFAGAGTLNLTPKQQADLLAPFDLKVIEILPSGEIYVPQIQYRIRLNRVFGPGSWALVPLGEPRMKGGSIIQKWHLVAYGKFVAEAWGEQDYSATNSRTSEVTAVESAKSNGLVRCCKDLGIGSELWARSFIEEFKTNHCVCPKLTSGKYAWRRKDAKRHRDEVAA